MGPLRISCLCSCHSSCFERVHHTSSPANVGMGLNDRLSPVSANETRELILSGVVKIAPPQQNTWHFSNQYQLSFSASLLASRQLWPINPFQWRFFIILMPYKCIWCASKDLTERKWRWRDVSQSLKRFQGVLQLIVCPWTSKIKDLLNTKRSWEKGHMSVWRIHKCNSKW